MRIRLDWPDSQLWPNRSHHWTARNRRRQEQKRAAWITCLAEGRPVLPAEGPVTVTLTFCAPDRRRYDLDNATAAMKGALDGLALALRVDDSRFALTLARGEPAAGGAVVVEVTQALAAAGVEGLA